MSTERPVTGRNQRQTWVVLVSTKVPRPDCTMRNLYGPFTSEDYAYRRAHELRSRFVRSPDSVDADVAVTVHEVYPLIVHRIVRWTREAVAFLRGETYSLAPYIPTGDDDD